MCDVCVWVRAEMGLKLPPTAPPVFRKILAFFVAIIIIIIRKCSSAVGVVSSSIASQQVTCTEHAHACVTRCACTEVLCVAMHRRALLGIAVQQAELANISI